MNIFDRLGKFRYMFFKQWHDFYHPLCSENAYLSSGEFEISVQIGGKRFPQYPLKSPAEIFAALKKCLGIQQSSFHSINIDPFQYRTHSFIAAIDTEKVLNASLSGENVRNVSLVTLLTKNVMQFVNYH